MNNVFEIKRFGKILTKDLKESLPKLGIIALSVCGFILVYWLYTLVLGGTSTDALKDSVRRIIISVIGCVLCVIIPFIIYKRSNHKKHGIYFAMLPASALEKFLSMTLMCLIVCPVIIFGGMILTDTLMAALTPNIDSLSMFGSNKFVAQDLSEGVNYNYSYTISGNSFISTYFEMIQVVIIFMFGNMFFQKSKFSKTILSILACSFMIFAIMALAMKYATHHVIDMLDICTTYLLPMGLLYGVFRRIQIQKY